MSAAVSASADDLREIYKHLPDASSRAAVRAVCRRWREAADESRDVWASVSLRRPPPASAPGPSRLAVRPRSPIPLQPCLLLLARQHSFLRRLHVEEGAFEAEPNVAAWAAMAAVLEAACGEGSKLTDLSLGLCSPRGLPRQVSQALPGAASQLTALTIRPVPGGGAPARFAWRQLSHLRQLSCLSLTADFSGAGPATLAMAQLTSLTRLRLHGVSPRPRGAAPTVWDRLGVQEVGPAVLACPTSLKRLELAAVVVSAVEQAPEAGGAGGGDGGWAAALAAAGAGPPAAGAAAAAGAGGGGALAALLAAPAPADAGVEAAEEAGDGGAGPAAAGAGPAEEEAAAGAGAGQAAPGDGTSDDEGAEDAVQGRWGHVMGGDAEEEEEEAAGPLGRWAGLEALRLHGVCAADWLMEGLPRLPSLTSLHLAPTRCDRRAVRTAQQCSHLQELVIGRYREESMPALPKGALSQLTRLRISGSDALMKFPSSWCSLPNLLSFEMESCEQLLHLPIEFGAMGLERLSFSHQRTEDLLVSFTALTGLTRLAVAACSLEDLPPAFFLSSLRELVLFANNLSSVPEALADPAWGPKGLHRLDLSGNYGHHLSEADVQVLRALPRLGHLNLTRQLYRREDEHSRERLAELRAALPYCEVLV